MAAAVAPRAVPCEALLHVASSQEAGTAGAPAGQAPHPASRLHLACGSLAQAKADFLQQHGASYGYNGWVDAHWAAEVGVRLPGQHYLDHTGAGQYTTSQLTAALQELATTAYGNPHSRNPSSHRATEEVAAARALVLAHFNADPDEYHVVFTKGATEGLKMVGEYFPWVGSSSSGSSSSGSSGGRRSHYIYTQANHKSVLGVGAYARHAGAALHCVSSEQMQQWLAAPGPAPPQASLSAAAAAAAGCCAAGKRSNGGACAISLNAVSGSAAATVHSERVVHGSAAPASQQRHAVAAADGSGSVGGAGAPPPTCHLVAYPAKDNYEGQLHPLEWIEQVHAKSDASNRFFVVLDAAAFLSTHGLDLAVHKVDFLPMSFYKLFGYPSGLGALLVRKEAACELTRAKVYFGGGSVDYCTAEDAWHVLSAAPAGLEDGTLAFLSIIALKHGFNLLRSLGGMKAIGDHVETLRLWTHQQLCRLTHSNGQPLLRMFGRHAEGRQHQCGIFQFQVLTPSGDRVPGGLVEAAATAAGLHLRTGCNCNPGRCLANLGITPEEERARAAQRHKGPVIIVMRPQHATSGAVPQLPAAAPGPAAAKQQASMVPVPLPLGSVRASLGALSTFEDVYALVRFLATTFQDFEIYERDVKAGVKFVRVWDDAALPHTVRADVRVSEPGAAAGGDAAAAQDSSGDGAVGEAAADGARGVLLPRNAAGLAAALRSFWHKWEGISASQAELWLSIYRRE